jgi:hypothetical protein
VTVAAVVTGAILAAAIGFWLYEPALRFSANGNHLLVQGFEPFNLAVEFIAASALGGALIGWRGTGSATSQREIALRTVLFVATFLIASAVALIFLRNRLHPASVGIPMASVRVWIGPLWGCVAVASCSVIRLVVRQLSAG